MNNSIGFLYGADCITGYDLVAGFNLGSKVPFFAVIKRRYLNASGKAVSGNLHNLLKGTLNTVVDGADKSRSQLNRKRCTCRFNYFTGAESRCFLVNLNRSTVAVHFDDLSDQAVLTYSYNVKHISFTHALCNDERTCNLSYNSACQILHLSS